MAASISSDQDLLRSWVRQQDEAALEALIDRYRHLVHRTARRVSGDGALAADASQLVFVLLARKAPGLLTHPTLAGWLHLASLQTTRDLIRKRTRESRKIEHYQAAMEHPGDPSDTSWKELEPMLDAALADLSGKDREALLLRFYRALSIRDVGQTLGISAAAAQKRIDRALERLRRQFARRGCTLAAPLATVLLAGFASDAQAAVPAASALAAKAATGGLAAGSQGLAGIFMKSTPLSLPALVLLAGGCWIASQFHAIAGLKEDAAAAKDSATTQRPGSPVPTSALDRNPVDWAEVVRQIKENDRFYGIKPHPRLMERISRMSVDELQAALDQVSLARLTDDDRELVQQRLAQELVSKGSPRLAMDRFLPDFEKGSWKWTMGGYFKSWIDRSPDEAIHWLADHIDRMPNPSFGFLDASFHPLLESSPQTAGRLLAAIPAARRLESLRSLENGRLSPTQQESWAALVRELMPDEDRLHGITWPTLRWSDGDGAPMPLEGISAYLDRIEASHAERGACILAAARDRPELLTGDAQSLADSLEPFRRWVRESRPDLVDRASGIALAHRFMDMQEDAMNLILDYHSRIGSDDVLLPVIEHHSGEFGDRDKARMLASHLRDPALRRIQLEKLR